GLRRAAPLPHGVRGRDAARALPLARRRRLHLAQRRRRGLRVIPDRPALAEALASVGADGWLLFAFHGLNPVATRILELEGLNTRRLFVYLPREGDAVAVAHRIELAPVADFPGRVLPYSRWQELHAALGSVVAGKRLAMEVSPEDAVPYLDRGPAGVVELIRRLGGTGGAAGPPGRPFGSRWERARGRRQRRAAGGPARGGRGGG